jgi:serine O-acetyltransferase
LTIEKYEARQISAREADMSREYKTPFSWCPSRSLLASIRAYQRHAVLNAPFSHLARYCAVLRHRFWSIVTGADIPVTSRIAGGLLLPHPSGVVIHPKASIGPNCLIFGGVSIGTRNEDNPDDDFPKIGGHVDIGANATIIGPVRIGDHARIGAGAVVVDDVPAGRTAVGVPATVLPGKPRPAAKTR